MLERSHRRELDAVDRREVDVERRAPRGPVDRRGLDGVGPPWSAHDAVEDPTLELGEDDAIHREDVDPQPGALGETRLAGADVEDGPATGLDADLVPGPKRRARLQPLVEAVADEDRVARGGGLNPGSGWQAIDPEPDDREGDHGRRREGGPARGGQDQRRRAVRLGSAGVVVRLRVGH